MNKLTMPELLEFIKECASPVGAAYLSKHLDSSAATIGRMLKQGEDTGYLTSISNKGRILTQKGKAFLDSLNEQQELMQNAEDVIALVFSEDTKHAIDILEFRKLIEPYAVYHATRRATEEDLQEIRDLDFEHRYVLRKGDTGSEQDLKVHLKFAEMSGNSAVFQVLKLILTENNIYQFFSSISIGGDGGYNDHKAILKAVYEKNPEAAAAAMERHIENLINLVKNYQKEKKE